MRCYECGSEFTPEDDEEEACELCQRQWYAEHMPEALGGELPNERTCFDCAGVGCDYCRHTGRIPA